MPFVTSNDTVGTAWEEIVTGKEEVVIQLLNSATLHLYVGASAPAADFVGHVLSGDVRKFYISNLTDEKIFARSASTSSIAITAR